MIIRNRERERTPKGYSPTKRSKSDCLREYLASMATLGEPEKEKGNAPVWKKIS